MAHIWPFSWGHFMIMIYMKEFEHHWIMKLFRQVRPYTRDTDEDYVINQCTSFTVSSILPFDSVFTLLILLTTDKK